jgi:inner membrane protein involved in colicin E2 resistance
MRMTVKWGMAVVTVGLLAAVGVAQEKKIKRSDLPAPVEKTVGEVSQGATIKEFSKETENGKTTYEVAMVVNGHAKDVEIDPNGTVVEIEEEVVMSALSAEVKDGLTAKAAGTKIRKVESITKQGKIVAYEAQVEKDGKKSIQVGPNGKPLDHEE